MTNFFLVTYVMTNLNGFSNLDSLFLLFYFLLPTIMRSGSVCGVFLSEFKPKTNPPFSSSSDKMHISNTLVGTLFGFYRLYGKLKYSIVKKRKSAICPYFEFKFYFNEFIVYTWGTSYISDGVMVKEAVTKTLESGFKKVILLAGSKRIETMWH